MTGRQSVVQRDLALEQAGILGKAAQVLVRAGPLAQPLAQQELPIDQIQDGFRVRPDFGVLLQVRLRQDALADLPSTALVVRQPDNHFRGEGRSSSNGGGG